MFSLVRPDMGCGGHRSTRRGAVDAQLCVLGHFGALAPGQASGIRSGSVTIDTAIASRTASAGPLWTLGA